MVYSLPEVEVETEAPPVVVVGGGGGFRGAGRRSPFLGSENERKWFFENLANPTALLLSSVRMLRHLEMHDKADRIQDSILNAIAKGEVPNC
ncbi:hypothetical protein Vadar_004104 [Vaccinium darrowii]|uniref:Uncharacterized protein n=1 Tax=Vaccinium darrowii TaxID=229202 RepID=A0ACB7ZIA2_9ERIC|nr:hypothetical protein Vadar_004104 [Vaccinium darrowii]